MGSRCIGFGLRRASRVLSQYYDEALRGTGLRITQFSLLNAIRARDPVTMGALAAAVATDRSTLSRNLGPLAREALIRIEPGADRRERVVRITPKGSARIERALPHWARAQRRVEKILGEARTGRVLKELQFLIEGAGCG